ncbi:spore coat protein YsxE [Anaerobacillus sp. MEB173]|uniref:spore coat protein YsxE n=1 Tax=Anaerobacillus sp. MEB173 TaxID=3383345 RepID=UPI003F93E4D1
MSLKTINQSYGPILFQYDLYPDRIEQHGKVKKIVTGYGNFALKKTNFTEEQAEWFIHVMRRLERLGYENVIPIIPTKYGDYIVTNNQQSYYLMPWLEEFDHNRISKEEVILQQMAKLHGLTEKEQKYSPETLENSYNALIQRWERRRLEMERFAQFAETKTYMSPFELTFLTHFGRLIKMAEDSVYYLKSWYEACQENGKYRSVLCHGRLSRHHTLFDRYGNGYLFNFERAILDTPARDLAVFYRKSLQYTPWDEDEGIRWMNIYQSQFPLVAEEKQLFISYLSYPEPVFRVIDDYQERKNYLTELQYVQRLEKRLLNMARIRRFIEKLSSIESE